MRCRICIICIFNVDLSGNGSCRSANRKIFDKRPEHRSSTYTNEKSVNKKKSRRGIKNRGGRYENLTINLLWS